MVQDARWAGGGCGIITGVDWARVRLLAVSVVVASGAVGMAGLAAAANRPAGRAGSCPHPTIPVPPNEPVYRSGPTALVTGLYIQGGPVPPPPCKPQPRGPYAGTVRVTDRRTGRVVASQSVKDGHLAHIRLAVGRYKVTGHFSGGATAPAVKVRVRAGRRVRQDIFEDVP
jgi:hypothetical protein